MSAAWLRADGLVPVEVVGLSFSGWLAAEMMANDPSVFRRAILVAPPGIRPAGEIVDPFERAPGSGPLPADGRPEPVAWPERLRAAG